MLDWLGKREKAFWVLLSAVMVLLWVFMEIADGVAESETMAIDRTILMMMRDADDPAHALGPPWLLQVAQDITALGGNAVLSLLSIWVMAFLFLTDKHKLAVIVLVATGGALVASLMLKIGFDRPRPDLFPHATTVYTSSFPSGHSMLAASAYLTMGALLAQTQSRRRVKALIIIGSVFLTIIIGISRVYLGVHWPSDVVAGWTVGAVWAMACSYLARASAPKHSISNL